jgi:chromosomal replication initiator protein
MKAWYNFLDEQAKLLGTAPVNKWLRSLKILKFDACNIYLQAIDTFQVHWFDEHIRPSINNKLRNNNNHPINVVITTIKDGVVKTSINKNKDTSSPFIIQINEDDLDENKTFDTFIPTNSSDIAYKLLCEVTGYNPNTKTIEPPKIDSSSFNPILLYGGEATGKTHLLMSAVAIFKKNNLKTFFIKASTFTNHVIQAIRLSQMQKFREIYRQIDVLVIDDIHVLSNKNATQEELFHTFNTLHTASKLIILSSNKPPSQLRAIEPRLISRFEWGISIGLEKLLLSDIKKILKSKAQLLGLHLTDEQEGFLLKNFGSNTRSINKAMEALVLRLHLDNNTNKLDMVSLETTLKDLIQNETAKPIVTPEVIILAVAKHYKIESKDILGKVQTKEYSLPRQISMFLCRKNLTLPYAKIGMIFSRDHSTVITSIKAISKHIDKKNLSIILALKNINEVLL